MKRNIFMCVVLALTVLSLIFFSSCEGGDIHVDINGDINIDLPSGGTNGTDDETDTENKDTSTDTGSGDTTDTNVGGAGNENPDQGGENQGGTGNENPDQGGENQGGTGNENPDQGGDNQGGAGNENPDQGGENQGGTGSGDIGGEGDGENEEPPAPITYTDEDGFVYLEENGELYCVDFVRPVDATRVVYMPSEYSGKSVVGIKTNAFTDFGVKFGESEYRNASYYYTIAIPESITSIEVASFDLCWGIRICLYAENETENGVSRRLLDSLMKKDLPIILEWESRLTLFDTSEKTNRQARDSIWGFRPALGWSRYSAVEIPDFYE